MKRYAVTESGVITKVVLSDVESVPSNYIDLTTNEPHHLTTDETQAAYDLFKTSSYFSALTNKEILNNIPNIVYDSSIPMVYDYSIHRAGENFKNTGYTLDVDAVCLSCVTGDNSGTAHTTSIINLMNWFRDSWNIPISLCEPPKSNNLVQAWCKNSLNFSDTGTLYTRGEHEFYIYRRTN